MKMAKMDKHYLKVAYDEMLAAEKEMASAEKYLYEAVRNAEKDYITTYYHRITNKLHDGIHRLALIIGDPTMCE